MSKSHCCLNPACSQPLNVAGKNYCQGCGQPLISLDGRYRPIKSLGSGGFGRTFIAVDDKRFDKPCVIKQLVPQGAASNPQLLQKATQLFEQEAKQLEILGENHPQIPALLAYVEEGGYFYLVQQFVDGVPLHEVQQGRWSEAEVLGFLLDILPVLDYVHESGVIHRDIKPPNILKRQDSRYVLIDFGVAKVSVSGQQGTWLSVFIGTEGYAPYEQLDKNNTVQKVYPASDLYSLGVTCFYLLTGHDPDQLVKDDGYNWVNRWQRYLPSALSPELNTVLDKLLKKKYQDRYQSAAEVLTALKSASNPNPQPPVTPRKKPPVSVKPTVPVGQPKSQPKINKSGNILWSIAFIVMAGLFGINWQNNKPISTSQPSQPSQDGGGTTNLPVKTPDSQGGGGSQTNNPPPVTSPIAAPPSKPQVYTETLPNGVPLEMVNIPTGSFKMGSPDGEGKSDEHPQHSVEITEEYYMGKYEVTQAQWEAIMGSNPSYKKNLKNPVENVSWIDVQEFIKKLNQATGKSYRLPSASEWEYAARGGTQTKYHYGNSENDIGEYGWCYDGGSYDKGAEERGLKKPNQYGLYDTIGNVWEWVQDDYVDNYNSARNQSSYKDTTSGFKELRGGSWGSYPVDCRVADRYGDTPSYSNRFIGFRVALPSTSL